MKAALKMIIAKRGVRFCGSNAEKVGISEANLYRHFKSKDEILQGTFEKIGEGLLHNLDAVSKMADALALERLKRLFILHLEYIEKIEGIPRLVFSEEMHIGNENLKEKFLKTIVLYSARVESLIKEGQRSGLIRKDIEHFSRLRFMGMIQILTMKWSLSGFSFSLVDEGKKLWKNFEKCLSG